MRAMVFQGSGRPLRATDLPVPEVGPGQLLVQVKACAVCRTDLHILDGELSHPELPLIPGHEIVGIVADKGANTGNFKAGDRVGIPWLGWTCGECEYCLTGLENLCPQARFTGYTLPGGYAEFIVADHRYCFALPKCYSDVEAAPLMCAGLIGYRSLAKTGDASRIGVYGFGAAAHIITQVVRLQGREIYAFTRPGDVAAQRFARSLGAVWAGGADAQSPELLDAAIIFAPVGTLVPAALKNTRPGGIVVCGGIHMSDIPSFPYELLWGERTLCSVANLTRKDGVEFFSLVARARIQTTTQPFPLKDANAAVAKLRAGRIEGAAVLVP